MVNVASTDSADARSSFSNYGGTSVHIAAPGSSIYSTITKNSYATYSGTSMACPFVTGKSKHYSSALYLLFEIKFVI